jgi:hypothetical protein
LKRCQQKCLICLSAVADSAKNFQLPSPKALKNVLKNIILFSLKNIFVSAVGIRGKKISLLSATALNIFLPLLPTALAIF